MVNKEKILEREIIRKKNYSYADRDCGYYAVDEYYIALRDFGFISEDEYSKVRQYNETFYNERRYEDRDE